MKKLILLLVGFVLFSCSNKKQQSFDELIEGDNVAAMKAKQSSLKQSADSLNALSKQLENRIMELDPPKEKLVRVKTIQDTVYNHYLKLQANIETDQDAQVTPEFGGILHLNVREGQNVGRGALLGTISDGGLSDQLNQAKIQVDQARAQMQQAEIARDLAKTTFERQQTLWNQKIGSEMQFLQAKTNYETSQKQVLAASQQVAAAQKGVSGVQAQLAKTRLYAPFSGTVDQIIIQSGQVVGPGTPVLRLVNSNNVKAVANVPEKYLEDVKTGTEVMINIPSLNREVTSKVGLVSPSINPSNRTFRVEVPVQNTDGNVKPNLNIELLLNDYKNDSAIVVKDNVIRKDATGQFVFIVGDKNGQKVALKKYVDVGSESNGKAEILSGLKPGEELITEAPQKMQDGDELKIIK